MHKSPNTPRAGQSRFSPTTIAAAAGRADVFTTFLDLAARADLMAMLEGGDPITVFAPVDEAFAALPDSTMAGLQSGRQDELLHSLVLCHVVRGALRAAQIEGRRLRGPSMAGGALKIAGQDGLTVNGAVVVRGEVLAGTGVLFGIDRVLWPRPNAKPSAAPSAK